MPFYAVSVGRSPGIYSTWDECKEQVSGYPKARYKKFDTEQQASEFIGETSVANSSSIPALKPSQTNAMQVKKDTSFKAKDNTKKCVSVKEISLGHAMKHKLLTREEQNLPTSPVVYTDGCCLNNGRSRPIGGVGVYWAPQHPKNVSEYLDVEKPTNQKAELIAACRALETAIEMQLASVELRTDSMYTIKCITEWINRWETNGWKTAGNKEVMNKEIIVRLHELCQKISITWVHVPGHEGIYGNEEADRLSREGASSRSL